MTYLAWSLAHGRCSVNTYLYWEETKNQRGHGTCDHTACPRLSLGLLCFPHTVLPTHLFSSSLKVFFPLPVMTMTAQGYRVSFGGDEDVQRSIVVMIVQLCECTKNNCIVYFEYVNCMICELYINKAIIFLKRAILCKERFCTWSQRTSLLVAAQTL